MSDLPEDLANDDQGLRPDIGLRDEGRAGDSDLHLLGLASVLAEASALSLRTARAT